VATGNPGKYRELSALLREAGFIPLPVSGQLLAEAPEEPTDDYRKAAVMKAKWTAARVGKLALADDSGLEVEALDGSPGPQSARFAAAAGGPVAALVTEMRRRGIERSPARFRAVLAAATPAGQVRWAEGAWDGEVIVTPRGEGGFGYDPVFFVPTMGKTVAELSLQQKNLLSHRGQAFRRLLDQLRFLATTLGS